MFCKFEKTQAPTNDEDPSDEILKILDMGSISTRKHEWIVGSYLAENMKCSFDNLGSIKTLTVNVW